jgi:phospholipid/cholesterol/gamma-HCH transport system substrate-binding protein
MEREPGFTPVPKNLQFRVGLLIGFTLLLAVAFIGYVLYARGVFEATQRLTLIADNVEGVSVGMDMSFSGFPIGRVNRIALADDGRARIEVIVPLKDARWLRTSSIFTLERGIVGAARIRVFTANLQDPLLPDGAERTVLRGDTSEEIPRMVAMLRGVLENLEQMTSSESSLQASLANLRAASDRLAGPNGALSALLGSDAEAKKVLATLARANSVLASLDTVLANTDKRLYRQGGLMDSTERAVAQANTALGDIRESLKKLDQVLADAQKVAGSAGAATADLAALRRAVDESLRKITIILDEINRKWPFERQNEMKLP